MLARYLTPLLLLSSGATGVAQPSLRDPLRRDLASLDPFARNPFPTLPAANISGAAARAFRAAPLVSQGWATSARVRIAGESFVVIAGTTADRSGAAQAAYFIYQVVREDSVRLVFSAPYREYSGRVPGDPEPESELRACLLLRGSTDLAYITSMLHGPRQFVRPAIPRDGYYRWNRAREAFVHVAAEDAPLRRRCGVAPGVAGK